VVQRGSDRGSLTAPAGNARSGDRRDMPVGSDPIDAVISKIREVQVSGCVHGHVPRTFQPGCQGWLRGPWRASAGDGFNLSAGRNPADAPVAKIRHVKVARAIHRNTIRVVQQRLNGRPAVAGITRVAVAGYRGDHSG